MADASLTEKRKTAQNYRSEILEARIIANYGDPGLDEDYHFDILSRYVVVMIESYQRVLTADKYANMIALVKRPEPLWIDAAGTLATNPADQQRTDKKGNVSIGVAGSFATNGISRIYPAYTMGETIRIKKMSQPEQPDVAFFNSAFNKWDASSSYYGGWHSDGSSLPYFGNDTMKTALRQKTIIPLVANGFTYRGFLHKFQYEAFALYLAQSNSALSNGMAAIFNGNWTGNKAVYSANGGYAFANNTFLLLNAVSYEDMNVGGKARVATNECIPLVVATPNTFPVPSSRSIGTIAYTPTYATVKMQ